MESYIDQFFEERWNRLYKPKIQLVPEEGRMIILSGNGLTHFQMNVCGNARVCKHLSDEFPIQNCHKCH
jgi:hypothetical protein